MWEKITNEAICLGLIPASKNSKYIRDIYWQNIRRRTIRKIDDSRKIGAAGGKQLVLDDIDNMVIDIVGKFIVFKYTRHSNYKLICLLHLSAESNLFVILFLGSGSDVLIGLNVEESDRGSYSVREEGRLPTQQHKSSPNSSCETTQPFTQQNPCGSNSIRCETTEPFTQ